ISPASGWGRRAIALKETALRENKETIRGRPTQRRRPAPKQPQLSRRSIARIAKLVRTLS
ncbi:hypothetical protein NYR54_18180, partial [Chelativorans sp. SCAU2101]